MGWNQMSICLLIYFVTRIQTSFGLSAVALADPASSVCNRMNQTSFQSLQFCAFLKISNAVNVSVLFTIQESNRTIHIMQIKDHLGIQQRNRRIKFQRKFWPGRWLHLCIEQNATEKENFKMTLNYIRNKMVKSSLVQAEVERKEELKLSPGNSTVFCIGDLSNKNSFTGEVSWLTHLATLNNSNNSAEYPIPKTDKCLSYVESGQEWQANFSSWEISGLASLKTVDRTEVCLGTQNIQVIREVGNYQSHRKYCNGLQGRFLLDEEIAAYKSLLKMDGCNGGDSSKELLLWKNEKIYLEIEDADGEVIERETNYTDDINLSMKCPYFSTKETNGTFSCFKKLTCVACIYPNSLHAFLFGNLDSFDREYRMQRENFQLSSLVSNRSSVSYDDHNWLLTSSLHDEVWILKNSTAPYGRKVWVSQEGNKPMLLTFTTCQEGEFTCSDGGCLPIDKRCDGILDCKDKSDEEDCRYIEKKDGYTLEKLPSKISNQSHFEIQYFIEVKGLDEIKASEGTTRFDVMIFLLWKDPGLTFWHKSIDINVNCSSIWSPRIGIKDKCEQGMQMDFKPYRSQCLVNPNQQILFSNESQNLLQSYKDPYMGIYRDGSEQFIIYSFNAMVDISCGFELQNYPFGTQTCSLCFWDDKAATGGYHYLVPYAPYYEYRGNKNHLQYRGSHSLGEFLYIESSQSVSKNGFTVEAVISLSILYEYHLLNSFVPSTVVFVITYATLFYPIVCFNERVSVSLTALLALVVHFVETNAGSLETPYFKLLDIWFVALIFLSFVVIVFNGHLHLLAKTQSGNESQENGSPETSSIRSDKEHSKVIKTLKNFNKALTIIIPIVFGLFSAWFVLKALG